MTFGVFWVLCVYLEFCGFGCIAYRLIWAFILVFWPIKSGSIMTHFQPILQPKPHFENILQLSGTCMQCREGISSQNLFSPFQTDLSFIPAEPSLLYSSTTSSPSSFPSNQPRRPLACEWISFLYYKGFIHWAKHIPIVHFSTSLVSWFKTHFPCLNPNLDGFIGVACEFKTHFSSFTIVGFHSSPL